MTQSERRLYLITELKKESPQYANLPVPSDTAQQKLLLRALLNVRMPKAASNAFLKIQDEYLKEEIREKALPISVLLNRYNPIFIYGRVILPLLNATLSSMPQTVRCSAVFVRITPVLTMPFIPFQG